MLSGTWKVIGQEELQLGKAVWEAYTADPGELQRVLEQDTSALPFVEQAFRLHLACYPAMNNGLGIVERTTLEKVAAGVNAPFELFRHVGDQLHQLGMGDLQYWVFLNQMCSGSHPLLKLEGAAIFPDYKQSPDGFAKSTLALTDYGKRVLQNEADWVSDNGINRWYGGVHLQGKAIRWRWDTDAAKLVEMDGV
ncbi:hypothetical protein [Paenibacillus sp. GCM10027626]|uniref:hypothetical protein n=1 Tax=Paenibacillus sp. GCM10027626 TaxID=3273411 RepID=UPI003635A61C